MPSLAGLRRPPATAPRPTRSHRRRRLDPGEARLLPLPAHPFETDLVRAVRSGKTPYVRFDRNAYSIPHTHVRKPLTLVAGATCVRIFDGQTELAIGAATTPGRSSRPPSTSKGSSPPPPRPTHTPPATAFASPSPPPPRFDRVAERGEPLRPHATRLLALLDDYGPQELAAALERDALGAGFIAHILDPCIHRNR